MKLRSMKQNVISRSMTLKKYHQTEIFRFLQKSCCQPSDEHWLHLLGLQNADQMLRQDFPRAIAVRTIVERDRAVSTSAVHQNRAAGVYPEDEFRIELVDLSAVDDPTIILRVVLQDLFLGVIR